MATTLNLISPGVYALEQGMVRSFLILGDEKALLLDTGAEELDNVPESPLYLALQALMAENHTHITTYSETKELYRYTDCQNGGGVISSFYSGASIGPDWDGTGSTPGPTARAWAGTMKTIL